MQRNIVIKKNNNNADPSSAYNNVELRVRLTESDQLSTVLGASVDDDVMSPLSSSSPTYLRDVIYIPRQCALNKHHQQHEQHRFDNNNNNRSQCNFPTLGFFSRPRYTLNGRLHPPPPPVHRAAAVGGRRWVCFQEHKIRRMAGVILLNGRIIKTQLN